MMRFKIPFPGRRLLGRRAIAAVEFALCVPVLLLIFMGTIELFLLYRTQAKLNALTANYAQMVSLQENPTSNGYSPIPVTATDGTTSLTDLCQGAVYGLQPFPPKGLTIDVASVTQTAAAKTTTNRNGSTTATPATYDAWEVDMNSTCTASTGKNQAIGGTNGTGAASLATGSGVSANAMIEGPGDNIIIVKATLQYPGVLGLFLKSAPTLNQTSVARWRNATPTNVSSGPSPSATLELICLSGSGCITHSCNSATTCT